MKKLSLSVISLTIVFFLCLFIGLSLNGCSPDKSEEYTGPVESLKIGLAPYTADFFGLLFLAEIQGFFKEQGLGITFVSMPSGADAIKALRKGSVDMGTSTEFPFVTEVIQGRNLKVITTVYRGDVVYIASRRDRGIRKPSDLKGKKIAVTLGTQLEFFLARYLLYHGMTLEDIHIIDTRLQSLIDPLLSGEADGVVCAEPDLKIVRSEIGDIINSWPLQNEQPTYAVIVCRGEFVKYHPNLTKRFLQALRKAELYYQDNPQKSRAQILDYPARKDSVFKDDLPFMSYGLYLEKPFLVMLEDEARWFIARGQSDAMDVPNFLDFIYFDGLDSVKPDGISIIR
jgi:NitT/TauT family transport system substrate-binding protein